MPAAPLPADEKSRIRALHALEVLGSGPEPEFDALVNIASLVCGVPFSSITLIDTDRQWFKATKGMHGIAEAPRSVSFCAHAILGQDVLEVPDATQDPRFSDNPTVTSGPCIRFYAGAPLILSDGHQVGTLCVSDLEPHQLDATQRAILRSLAVAASRALEGRKAILAQENTLRELHKSELLLDRTGRLAQVGGWEVDLLTGKNDWTDETRRIYGVPPDYEPSVEQAINYFAREAQPIIQQAVSLGIAEGTGWDLELPFVRHDGTPIWVRAVGAVDFEGGKAVRLVGALQDVTARRVANMESQKNALLLRSAIDIIDEAFVVFDPQDRLVLCNEKYREIYAASAPMIMPGNTFEQIVRYGVERGQYLAAIGQEEEWIAQRLESHRLSNSTQFQKLNDDRSLRVVERKLPDGHIVGFRVDITDQVRAIEAAQQASHAKGQFLANMSHEIRTPMNAMLGMLTLLRKTPLTPQQTDYVTKSEGATRLLLGVINDILDYSKIEAGHLTLDNQPFDMQQLVQDLRVILSTSAGAKPVKVTYQIDLGLPQRLVGDAMRLQQVLVNLGGNAIKFTPQGQVHISIRLKGQTPYTAHLEAAVTDTGVGISPENQARIFDGFSQAETSTTRRFGGTGLGLTISQRLVAQMGGELKVVSVLGQGSRFYFSLTLPYLPAAQLAAAVTRASTSPRLIGMRLLLAEDNPASQQVARELLQLEGAVVQVAGDGQQAIDAIEARQLTPTRFDLVLMDIQMPVMDGFTATRHIRQVLGHKDLPIVAMTANALDSDRKACLAAGMNAHVAKPFDLDHLVSVLQHVARPMWELPEVQTKPQTPPYRQNNTTAIETERTQPTAEAYQAAQEARIDLDAALKRLGNNLPLYTRALRSFIDDLVALPTQLLAHRAAGELTQAASTLHKLKGLASTLGVNTLADVAKQGEVRLKAAGTALATTELTNVVAQTCDGIATVLPRMVTLLRLLQTSQSPSTQIVQRSPTPGLDLALRTLASKLENFDMDAVPLMTQLKQTWGSSPALQSLEDAIDSLDFEEALRLCHTLTWDDPT